MFSIWKSEINRLIVVTLLSIVVAIMTNQWFWTTLIVGGLYITYHLFNLYRVHRWLVSELNENNTPDISGVWGDVIKLIYQYKRHSEKNHTQQKQLLEQFIATLSAIPNAALVLTESNEIEWANHYTLGLLGIDNEKDRGFRIDNLIRQQPFIEALQQSDIEKITIPSPIAVNKTLEIHIAHYALGKKLLIAHDISEHLELRETRKQFIANASHELRTPLTVITGYLDFIGTDGNLPHSLKQPVADSITQANYMQSIIEDLLLLSKLEHKSLKAKKVEKIDLASHLKGILDTFSHANQSNNHIISTQVNGNLMIEASRKELTSLCTNLLINAIKYSPVNSEITISWKKIDNNHLIFSVTDQGIGIAPEHIPHLTERFYRVDDSRSRDAGGTGLGLSIVKHIIERHHGQLTINSRLGHGSTFAVTLPIYFKKQNNKLNQ